MIGVLVLDDEALVAEAHASYVARIDGFEVRAVAHTAAEAHAAMRRAAPTAIDLVLLDLSLPDAPGLELARRLRAERRSVDILAVTAVRDLAAVQEALAVGVVGYLVKPFGFPALRDRLEQYARFRSELGARDRAASQAEVDSVFAALRHAPGSPLPKGLSESTLGLVAGSLRQEGPSLSATEVADALGISRVTARRYLEHLAATGTAARSSRYGAPGRPEIAYAWVGRGRRAAPAEP